MSTSIARITATLFTLALVATACGGATPSSSSTAPGAAATSTPRDDFPTRPITLVVGFAAGGGADVFGRALSDAAKTTLSQPMVVENRAGAGGATASAYVIGRPADGYTLLFAHAGSSIITPIITKNPTLKWDAFEPVARIHAEEEWLMVQPNSQFKTVADLVTFAKANPKKVRVAGSAIGGVDSFTVLAFEKAAGIDLEYIPFDGGGPAQLSFLGGNAEVLVGNVSEFFQNIEAKKMTPLTVASDKRSSIFADVPTLKESGYDVVYAQWRSVMAPKGTPANRIALLAEAFQKAMSADPWKNFNKNAKAIDLYAGPTEFRTFLRSEDERFSKIITELGL